VIFRQAGLAWATVYSATFFRIQFSLSLSSTALIVLVGSLIFVLSEITGGFLVNKFGRKRQLVGTLVISSPILMLVAFIPNLWIVLVLIWTGGFIYGLGFPANTSLILEQAPESRRTMMSMSTIFITLGLGVGTAIGGLVLALFESYVALILVFAILNLTAAAIYFFLIKDPYGD
jgi:MFS family permease